MRLEVWLLHAGGNPEPEAWKSHIQAQLSVPQAHSWPTWLTWLMNWFVLRWRERKSILSKMSNPCPSLTLIHQEAAEFERLLGPPFRCRSLQYFGTSTIETHLKSVPPKSTIFLLPLQFLRGLTVQQLLDSSRQQLRSSGHRVCELAYPPLQQAYIDSLSMAVRAAIIQYAQNAKYGVLLLLPSQPQGWKTLPEPVLQEAEDLRTLLVKQIGQQTPVLLAQQHGSPSVQKALKNLQTSETQVLIACTFGSLLSDGELDTFIHTKLKSQASLHGMTETIQISMPTYRTTFFRVARTQIYQSAEGLSF